MDNQVPELMWQPDVQLYFLKKRLRREFKDETEIEAFVQTNDLPVEVKQDILKTISQVKKLRAENKQKLDDIGVKPKKDVELIR